MLGNFYEGAAPPDVQHFQPQDMFNMSALGKELEAVVPQVMGRSDWAEDFARQVDGGPGAAPGMYNEFENIYQQKRQVGGATHAPDAWAAEFRMRHSEIHVPPLHE